jgi:hypothetical protein
MPQNNSSSRRRRRRTDVVVIRFRRIGGRRIITRVIIIGRVGRCRSLLQPGERVGPAVRCLLDEGFRIVIRRDNELVLVRIRRRGL